MNSWLYSAALAAIASLTVSSGLLHGYLDGRWGVQPDVRASAAKLPLLPEQCGPWVQVSDGELDPSAQELLRCDGYLLREYWRPETGDRVKVAVLLGPRGPIAVHTPEVCYSSQGTEPVGERVSETIESEGGKDQLWHVQFSSHGSPSPTLDVWYAWSDGGPWQASEHPRFWLAHHLYKIQLAGSPAAEGEESPCRDFLTFFLPVVRAAIRTP